MDTYTPSSELTKAVLAAMLAPVPFGPSLLIKAIPTSLKERAISLALWQVLPMAIGSIALTQSEGARIPLTTHGELREKVKFGLLRRIAAWFTPSEVKDVSRELHNDVRRLAESGFSTESWRLEIANDEVVLVVLDTSLIKRSADTVVDIASHSGGKIQWMMEQVMRYMPKRT